MLRTRIIPCLLLKDGSLVKTVRFRDPSYIGDPINTARIFNELMVDELFVLDIGATPAGSVINFPLLRDLATECFMPVGYGGGIDTLAKVEQILKMGYEKVVINSAALRRPDFITEVANRFGSQCVVVAIDVQKSLFGRKICSLQSGQEKTPRDPVAWAKDVEAAGAGEILLTAVYQEGTWSGFDVPLVRSVVAATTIPVVAHGGGGSVEHVRVVLADGRASSVVLGSMVVYQKKGMGVLVNFPGGLQ